MFISNPLKFHHDILNAFQVNEQTRLECKFCYFPFKRATIRKIYNPELQFLCSARCLMLVSNHMKFHHDIFLNSFRVTERTRPESKFCYFLSKGQRSSPAPTRLFGLRFGVHGRPWRLDTVNRMPCLALRFLLPSNFFVSNDTHPCFKYCSLRSKILQADKS